MPEVLASYSTIRKAKCAICCQLGPWTKECPNKKKSPKSAAGSLGCSLPLELKDPSVRASHRFSNGYIGLKRSPPVGHTTRDFHYWTVARLQMDVAGRSITFLLDTGATYSVLTSFSKPFSSRNCTVLGVTGKPISQYFTSPLCCL